MDHQGLAPIDCHLLAEPDAVVPLLRDAVKGRAWTPTAQPTARAAAAPAAGDLTVAGLAAVLNEALGAADTCLIRVPLSWSGDYRAFRHPLDYLGADGGGGIGSGPGMAVGAALALRGSDRLPVAVLGDGDFLMGVTALWTATHYRVPLLVVVANNRSFFNDELHQERVARERGRPIENRWIGQRIADPDVDCAGMARAQGALGFGQVSEPHALATALREAIDAVRAGAVAVVDARVATGYHGAMAAGMLRGAQKAAGN